MNRRGAENLNPHSCQLRFAQQPSTLNQTTDFRGIAVGLEMSRGEKGRDAVPGA